MSLPGQLSLPFDKPATDTGRECIACSGETIVVKGAYGRPVERCSRCKLEREIPKRSGRSGGTS